MKKETLLEIILGTIGGLIFAIGMCMSLVEEWDMLVPGIVVASVGFIILLCIIPVYRKSHPRKKHGPINWSITLTWLIGILASLIMGFGMSKVLVGTPSTKDMIIGIITGVIGLIICVLNYPVYSYITSDKK